MQYFILKNAEYLQYKLVQELMGTRKIPVSDRALTGSVASKKNGRQHEYESSLERDLITILEFDTEVDSYEEQPVRVDYIDEKGVARYYTPDFLVKYHTRNGDFHIIYEVKYRADLWANWKELKPKFMAGLRYAAERGYRFKIMTEMEIRTGYLENARFLLAYLNADISFDNVTILNDKMLDFKETTPEELLMACASSEENRLILMHTLWYMLANKRIQCDMNRKIQMDVAIWIDTVKK